MKSRRLLQAAAGLGLAYGALVATAYWPRKLDPTALQPGPADRFVQVEGHLLRYQVAGAGPPLLLIHGFAGSLAGWRTLVPLLARRATVYALDLLGFGLSAKPARADHSLRGHGRRVAAFCAALNLAEVTLVGHSMGGVVAAWAALQDHEQRLARLALLSANFYRRNGPPIPLVFPLPRLLARRFYHPAGRLASLRRCYADPACLTAERLESYLAPTRLPGAIEALGAFLATPGPPTYAELPAQLALPTLVLWGRQDALWPPADGQRLAAEIAGAQLALIEGAGHNLHEERPAELGAALEQFIEATGHV